MWAWRRHVAQLVAPPCVLGAVVHKPELKIKCEVHHPSIACIGRGGGLECVNPKCRFNHPNGRPFLKAAAIEEARWKDSAWTGRLQHRWTCPSDHLPVGCKLDDDLVVVSWNVLNSQFPLELLDQQGFCFSLL